MVEVPTLRWRLMPPSAKDWVILRNTLTPINIAHNFGLCGIYLLFAFALLFIFLLVEGGIRVGMHSKYTIFPLAFGSGFFCHGALFLMRFKNWQAIWKSRRVTCIDSELKSFALVRELRFFFLLLATSCYLNK